MASRTYITSNAKVSKIKIHSVHVGANIDKSIKKRASEIVKAQGLTMSEVVRMFITDIADNHNIPNYYHADMPNDTTIAALEEANTKKLMSVKSIKELRAAIHEKS